MGRRWGFNSINNATINMLMLYWVGLYPSNDLREEEGLGKTQCGRTQTQYLSHKIPQSPCKQLIKLHLVTTILNFQKFRAKLSNLSTYCRNLQLGLKKQRSRAKQQAHEEPRSVGKCLHTASDTSEVHDLHVYTTCFYSHLIFCPIIGETFFFHLKHTVIIIDSFLIHYSNVLSI